MGEAQAATPPLSQITRIPHLGLVAGKGRFPFLLAQAAAGHSIPVTAFAIKGITPPELANHVRHMHWLELGQLSLFIERLHEQDIRHVVMAGRVPHNSIWRYRGFDKRALRLLGKMVTRKADSLLGAVVRELEREQVQVIDSSVLLRDCMPGKGLLTPGRELSDRERKDVDFGYPIAREIAGMDIGQTIVVKDLAVVAVESLEGTDATIRRAGSIAGGGIVVIKVSKPDQDSRFDVPVVGPGTMRSIQRAGGGVLAFKAGETLFFDQDEALELAKQGDIGVVAI